MMSQLTFSCKNKKNTIIKIRFKTYFRNDFFYIFLFCIKKTFKIKWSYFLEKIMLKHQFTTKIQYLSEPISSWSHIVCIVIHMSIVLRPMYHDTLLYRCIVAVLVLKLSLKSWPQIQINRFLIFRLKIVSYSIKCFFYIFNSIVNCSGRVGYF